MHLVSDLERLYLDRRGPRLVGDIRRERFRETEEKPVFCSDRALDIRGDSCPVPDDLLELVHAAA